MQVYLQEGFEIWSQVVIPLFVHIFLRTSVCHNIIHEVLVGKRKRTGMDSPDNSFIVHAINGGLRILFVHSIHNVDATFFKQSESQNVHCNPCNKLCKKDLFKCVGVIKMYNLNKLNSIEMYLFPLPLNSKSIQRPNID